MSLINLKLIQFLAPSNSIEAQQELVGEFISELEARILDSIQKDLEDIRVKDIFQRYQTLMDSDQEELAVDALFSIGLISKDYSQQITAIQRKLYAEFVSAHLPKLSDEDKTAYANLLSDVELDTTVNRTILEISKLPLELQQPLVEELANALVQ